jgi:hypothetical protein
MPQLDNLPMATLPWPLLLGIPNGGRLYSAVNVETSDTYKPKQNKSGQNHQPTGVRQLGIAHENEFVPK